MQKNQEKKEYTILQLMEVLSEKSDDSQLSEAFWAENRSANLLGRDCKKMPLLMGGGAIAATFSRKRAVFLAAIAKNRPSTRVYLQSRQRPARLWHETRKASECWLLTR